MFLNFFLNPHVSSYLRELAAEFSESSNGVRVELERLTKTGLLKKKVNGRTIKYSANTLHPLFPELNTIVRKYFGIDKIIDEIHSRLGNVEAAYIIGDYARH
ncbi:hypothetical protein KFV02_09065 [Desulfohalobiaceae bacterium Ax17]|uniref:hypothetical protein n=1 Tax=Desulfovulcanus ferrireducens TaxID=2831190 RepID=UPI00207BB9F1|nr:hypothetical protein [Desulfovulcanus ferrireducens]MBT8764080.1 hypothetical protein [Desulfovulcanus ferrireducens]